MPNPGEGEIFHTCLDGLWGPPSLLYNGYGVFPGGKVPPGRDADHSPPSSAEVMEEWSYNCTHPLGHTGPVTGLLYLYLTQPKRQNYLSKGCREWVGAPVETFFRAPLPTRQERLNIFTLNWKD
jgi:hypothetical protein